MTTEEKHDAGKSSVRLPYLKIEEVAEEFRDLYTSIMRFGPLKPRSSGGKPARP